MIEIKSSIRVFGGLLVKFSFESTELGLPTTASIFLPSSAADLHAVNANEEESFPTLFYLSGLTCTDDNVCMKGCAVFSYLADNKMAMLCPDTSPRGAGAPGEDDSWDFGTGAGFYVDATTDGFKNNYRMYSFVSKELPALLKAEFPCCNDKFGITGHSMGGHGALQIALKNSTLFRSVSAFAPIANPINCPWGRKAFEGYLGSVDAGEEYDSAMLMAAGIGAGSFDDILVDVGTADTWLEQGQLRPEDLEAAADKVGQKLTLRRQKGYDHSYFFVSTFIADHIAFHSRYLK
jgi:S-formylglutathione hydrolase